MMMCQVEQISLVLVKLVILLKILGTNCDVASKNGGRQDAKPLVVATLKIFSSIGQEIHSSNLIEIYNGSNSTRSDPSTQSSMQKISGKLIYAKTYDQALLDKILNKSDTYYKRCVCDTSAASASVVDSSNDGNGQGKSIALVDRLSNQCSLDDCMKCAMEIKSSALLLNDRTTDSGHYSSSVLLNGYPIEVILIESSLGEKLAKLLNTMSLPNLIATITSTGSTNHGNRLKAMAIDAQQIQTTTSQTPVYNMTSMSTSSSNTSEARPLTTASILAIVFGILLIVFILVGLFSLFFCMQRSRLREDREKLQDLIEKLTKRAVSRMECRTLKPEDQEIKHNEICVICLENFKQKDAIRILPCLHFFHKDEIDTWIYKNHSCPVCKIDILKAEIDNSSDDWYTRLLVRLGLAKSSYELHEAVQTFHNHRRHYSIDADAGREGRYSAINQNTITTMASTSEEQRSRVFSEFVTLHQKRFSIDALNSALEQDDWRSEGRPKRIRRLNFFGETLEDFDYGEEEEIATETTNTNTTSQQTATLSTNANSTAVAQDHVEDGSHAHSQNHVNKNNHHHQVVMVLPHLDQQKQMAENATNTATIAVDDEQSLIRMNSNLEESPYSTTLSVQGQLEEADNQFQTISLDEEFIPK